MLALWYPTRNPLNPLCVCMPSTAYTFRDYCFLLSQGELINWADQKSWQHLTYAEREVVRSMVFLLQDKHNILDALIHIPDFFCFKASKSDSFPECVLSITEVEGLSSSLTHDDWGRLDKAFATRTPMDQHFLLKSLLVTAVDHNQEDMINWMFDTSFVVHASEETHDISSLLKYALARAARQQKSGLVYRLAEELVMRGHTLTNELATIQHGRHLYEKGQLERRVHRPSSASKPKVM